MNALLLLSLVSELAVPPDIKCPGDNTVEMRWCASKSLDESKAALEKKLSPEAMKQWREATIEVCSAAYRSYLQGTIYPQMVVGCDDRLNRVLLEEFKGLIRWILCYFFLWLLIIDTVGCAKGLFDVSKLQIHPYWLYFVVWSMTTYAISSAMSRIDYEAFLSLRQRLTAVPERLAEEQFLVELSRRGYDFLDYFGAHYIYNSRE